MSVLSVAEKPSVAKELANIIGKGSAVRRNGHSQYNHIFEIAQCEFMGRNVSMKITSVTGHMMGLEFDARYKNWQGVNPEQLFTAEIKKSIPQDKQGIRRTLEEEGRRASVLLLWLDCDLEGENIAYEVIDIASTHNKRLDIYRAKFSALIPRDIFRTLQHPERPNKHMSDAVDARQEIDLRLGAAFTRFQTMRLQGKFDALKDNVISYGPCQFPTLGFVVERYLKIQNFVSENFWSISCELETPDPDERGGVLKTSFIWERQRLYDRLACLLLFDMCVEIGTAVVTESQARPTSRTRPCPLNTIELQKRASRFLHMSSETTMKVAEALYQRGILSYPRTETDFFKEGFELLPLLEEHRGHADWGDFTARLLDGEGGDGTGRMFQWPRSGGHDDQAHPPIHPTRSVPLASLTDPQEKQLYELVSRHFLACCAPDATGQQTTLRVQMSRPARAVLGGQEDSNDMVLDSFDTDADTITSADGGNGADVAWLVDGEVFKATGLMVEERNWLDVYSKWEKWSGCKVAPLQVGKVFRPQGMSMRESRTLPPQALTESDLISEMDRNGIGTDATIAQHITTIQDRNYAFKDDQGRFVPTPLGIGLVEGYNVMGYQLNKPSLRASMEKDCQAVARGLMQKDVMVRNCLTQMRECFRNCVLEAQLLDAALGKHFPAIGQGHPAQYQLVTRNVSTCGVCHDGMDLKVQIQAAGENGNNAITAARNNPNRFLFCETCQLALMVPKKGELSQCEDVCPICSFQVLNVRNPDTQKTHTICPKCFSNPPAEHAEPGVSGEFRCFMCSHPTCSNAGRDGTDKTPFAQCFQSHCDGTLSVRKVDGKGFVASCSNYPECKASWWLPKGMRTVERAPSTCARCTQAPGSKGVVHRLVVKTIRSLVPPCVPPEDTACPCCSLLWEDLRHTPLQLPRIAGYRPGTANGNGKGKVNESAANVGRGRGMGVPGMVAGRGAPVQHQGGGAARGIERGHASSRNMYQPTARSTTATPSSNWLTAGSGHSNDATVTASSRNPSSERGQQQPPSRGTYQVPQQQRQQQQQHHGSEREGQQCGCGVVAVLRTVRKEGANQGRQFLTCDKPPGEQCGFFQFLDELEAPSYAPRVAPHLPQQQQQSKYAHHSHMPSNDAAPPLCGCNLTSVRRIVNKEGDNQGRGFFTCPQPRSQQCDFFEWDTIGDVGAVGAARGGNAGDRTGGGGRGRGRGKNAMDPRGTGRSQAQKQVPTSSDIICSRCMQVGHYARSCPNKNK